jgi:ribose 5-phosphate isomerase B
MQSILDHLQSSHKDFDARITWVTFDGDDYPDVAKSVIDQVKQHEGSRGIIVCGSAVGVAMCANRDAQIRAAACYDSEHVTFARRHEDINVLCLSAWWTPHYGLHALTSAFLTTPFEAGRHLRRIYKSSYLFREPR